MFLVATSPMLREDVSRVSTEYDIPESPVIDEIALADDLLAEFNHEWDGDLAEDTRAKLANAACILAEAASSARKGDYRDLGGHVAAAIYEVLSVTDHHGIQVEPMIIRHHEQKMLGRATSEVSGGIHLVTRI